MDCSTHSSSGSWRTVLGIATVVVIVGIRNAGAQAPSRAANQAPACEPVERLEIGRPAGDSTIVQGKHVPRTREALRSFYAEPRGPSPFYPGERVVIGVAGRKLGLATFDGCTLIREWPGPDRIPKPNSITSFDVVIAKEAPPALRDARGYRVLNVTAWKGGRRPAGA